MGEPRGDNVGYLYEGTLWLIPDVSLSVASRTAPPAEPWQRTRQAMSQDLFEASQLKDYDGGKRGYTKRKDIPNATKGRAYWAVYLEFLQDCMHQKTARTASDGEIPIGKPKNPDDWPAHHEVKTARID